MCPPIHPPFCPPGGWAPLTLQRRRPWCTTSASARSRAPPPSATSLRLTCRARWVRVQGDEALQGGPAPAACSFLTCQTAIEGMARPNAPASPPPPPPHIHLHTHTVLTSVTAHLPAVVREICPKGQGGADRMPVYLPENWPQQLMKLQPGLELTGVTTGGVGSAAGAAAAAPTPAAATSSNGSSGSSEGGSAGGTAAAARAAARGGALPPGILSLQRGAGALGPCPAGPLFAAAEAAAAAPSAVAEATAPAGSTAVSAGGGSSAAALFAPAAAAAAAGPGAAAGSFSAGAASSCTLPIAALRLPSLPAPVAPPVLTVRPICTGPPAGTPPAALSPLALAALAGGASGTPRSLPTLPSLCLSPLLATRDHSDWHSLGSTPTGAGLLTPTSALAAAMAAAGLGPSAPTAAAPIHAPPLQLHLTPVAPPVGPGSPASAAAAAARSSNSDDVAPMDRSSPDTSPSRLDAASEPQPPAPAGLSWVHAAV